MKKRNFLKFVFIGFLAIIAGELQVNFVLNKGISDFSQMLLFYLVFFVAMYAYGALLDYGFSSGRENFIYYFSGGLVGLFIEWFLIGNAPWDKTGAIQAGMFAWWAAAPTAARIFTTTADPLLKSVRSRIFFGLAAYSLVSTVIILILPVNLRPIFTGLMMTIGFIVINFLFIPYLTYDGFLKSFAPLFMWALALLALIDLFV